MTEFTEEQRAAVAWAKTALNEPMKIKEAEHLTALLSALPSELTNPQPVLPTEPGAYADKDGALWSYENGLWWFGNTDRDAKDAADLAHLSKFAPFTHLVPERPRVTRDEVARASFDALGAGKPGGVAFNDALYAALEKSTDRD